MASFQQKLFQNLLNQLKLDSAYNKYFQDGSLMGLTIHDQSNLWAFRISLNSLIPFKAFKQLRLNLSKILKSSKIRLVINVAHPQITSDLIKGYWPWVIKHCGLSELMAKMLIKDGRLIVTRKMISLKTHDEALRGFLANGALVQIENMYHQLGFPSFRINIPGGRSKRKLPAKVITFSIKKRPDDIKLARKAAKELDQHSVN